jgi:hypothetical protein
MKRRQFITLIGATAAWPLGAGALQPEQMRRIGVLMHAAADNPNGQMAGRLPARNGRLLRRRGEISRTEGRGA